MSRHSLKIISVVYCWVINTLCENESSR